MIESAVVYSESKDPVGAARDLAQQIRKEIRGGPPDAMVLFAAPSLDHERMLRELTNEAKPGVLVGASSAGEFTGQSRGQDSACVLALRSPDMKFTAGIGRDLSRDCASAARQIASSFHGVNSDAFPHRTALILTDALAGHAETLVDELTLATKGKYQFVGGGAGDNAQFRRTVVFHGGVAVTDAAVGLEILSKKPVGVGVGHGWSPASAPMRVTDAEGMNLVSLNGLPAAEAFHKHAQATGQTLDPQSPIPFFLQNVLGIATGGEHRLRVPLAINADGSVSCAAEIPKGAIVHIMRTDSKSAAEAASRATRAAVESLDGGKPKVALFFDCVATRLRLGDAFGFELQAVSDQLRGASFAGCNTHGQIARAEGQFGGFHNCTAVVCAFPE